MTHPCPLGESRCLYAPQTRRHNHPADLLNLIGQRCECGANDWHVSWGGLLPARVLCGACGAGFNIGERLRTCGKAEALVYRKVRR